MNTHISSKKHKANKEKQAKISMNEKDIAEALTKFDDKNHPNGETLPTSTRVFRVKVVRAYLKSGTPLSRLEYFRDFAEVSRRKLSDLIQQSSLQIRVEQAAVMEMEKFVKATYTLEGDGALVFAAF